jgi:hypothetical protein
MLRRLSLCALLLAALPAPALAQSQAASDGRALLEKVLRADGGLQRLRGVYAYRQKQRVQLQGAKGAEDYSWDVLVALPDRMHLESTSATGQKFTLIVAPGSSFYVSGETAVDLPAATAGAWGVSLRHSPFYIAQHLDDGVVQVALVGAESIGGATAKVLEITLGADVIRLSVDTKTMRPLRYAVQAQTDKGSMTQIVEPSDLRRVDGIQFAFHILVTQDGRQIATNDVQGVELNPEVDPRLFYRKPLGLDQIPFRPGAVTAVPLTVNATLQAVSRPPGAQLYLDDVPKGVTSEGEGRLVLEDVAPGNHRVRLTAAGFKEWNKTVAVDSGDTLAVDATLERSGPPPFSGIVVEQMLGAGVSPKLAGGLV